MDEKFSDTNKKLKGMNFRELKYELKYGDYSPQIELEIRKLMKDRAIQNKLRKRYLDMLPDGKDIVLEIEDDYNPTNNNSNYHIDELKDPKYCKDNLNNNLMMRMDNELSMRQENKQRRRQKNFIPPWA